MKSYSELKTKLNLEAPDELWQKFKESLPKTISINDAILQLIEDHVKRKNQ